MQRRCVVFIKNKILSLCSRVAAVLRTAKSRIVAVLFSFKSRVAALFSRFKIAGEAPKEALVLAAFFFAVIYISPSFPPDNGESGLGQPDFGPSFYEVYAEAQEDVEIVDVEIAEVPQKNILSFTIYTVEKGDTISEIARINGITQDSIISCNNIERARLLQIGTQLRIPNMSGLMHSLAATDTLSKLAATYRIPEEQLLEVNNIEESGLTPGEKIFIPNVKLPAIELRRVWGELFRYPVRGRITSSYGHRPDPFTGKRHFHNGIDIAGAEGQAVGAALEGRVIQTGFNDMSGNYVVVAHAGGYVSSYAHLSVIRVKTGDWLKDGQRLGDVGSTGYSTGAHLHFSVSRWGKSVNPYLLLH